MSLFKVVYKYHTVGNNSLLRRRRIFTPRRNSENVFEKYLKPLSEFRENHKFNFPREARRIFLSLFAPETTISILFKMCTIKSPVQIALTFENINPSPTSKLAAEI